MNHLLLQQLKEVLASTRKRMGRIEERRIDYEKSARWKELKKKESTICKTISVLKKDIEKRFGTNTDYLKK